MDLRSRAEGGQGSGRRDVSPPLSPTRYGGPVLLLGILACTWRGPSPVRVGPGVTPPGPVLAMDRASTRQLVLMGMAAEVQDEALIVTVALANRGGGDVPVQVVGIFPAEDPTLGTETVWVQGVVLDRQTLNLALSSTKPVAEGWELHVRVP